MRLIIILLLFSLNAIGQDSLFMPPDVVYIDSSFNYDSFSLYYAWDSNYDTTNKQMEHKDNEMKRFFSPFTKKYDRLLYVDMIRDGKWLGMNRGCNCTYNLQNGELRVLFEFRDIDYFGADIRVDSMHRVSSTVSITSDIANNPDAGLFKDYESYLVLNQYTMDNFKYKNRVSSIDRILTGYAYLPYSEKMAYAVVFRCFVDFENHSKWVLERDDYLKLPIIKP